MSDATILVVGVGTLGSEIARRLSEKGVKQLILCDYDIVEERNLERQPLYTREDIGKQKVDSAISHLKGSVTGIPKPFSEDVSLEGVDIIIEGTDSLEARLLINDAARKAGIPLIVGTASENKGFVFPVTGSPCWQCIVKGKTAVDSCDSGISSATVERITGMQVELAEKILEGREVVSALQTVGGRTIPVVQNPSCSACKGEFSYLSAPFSLSFCETTHRLQARPNRPKTINLEILTNVIERYATAVRVRLGKGTALVNRYGSVEFENVDESTAKRFTDALMR